MCAPHQLSNCLSLQELLVAVSAGYEPRPVLVTYLHGLYYTEIVLLQLLNYATVGGRPDACIGSLLACSHVNITAIVAAAAADLHL